MEATSLHNKNLGSVFYCIGKTANFLVNPVETINAHVNILSNILEYSNYESLIYLSSTRLNDSYFTENDQIPKKIDESSPLSLLPSNPRHLYDLSKALGECLCHQSGSNKATVVRLSCVWDLQKCVPGFLNTLIKTLKDHEAQNSMNKELTIDSDPRLSRHYIHMDDVLNSLITIANQQKSLATISLASDRIPTANEQIQRIINATLPFKIAFNSSLNEEDLFKLPKTPEIDISKCKVLLYDEYPPQSFKKHFTQSLQDVFIP